MKNMMEGLSITVIGIGIVFLVLMILWGLIELMRIVFAKDSKKKPTLPVAPKMIKEVVSAPVVAALEEDEDELIAVLTAAVACCLNTSTYNLNIKSFRRIDSNIPAWNAASRKENLSTQF